MKVIPVGGVAGGASAAAGISGGCGCISFMPGNLLHQLQSVCYFAELEDNNRLKVTG